MKTWLSHEIVLRGVNADDLERLSIQDKFANAQSRRRRLTDTEPLLGIELSNHSDAGLRIARPQRATRNDFAFS